MRQLLPRCIDFLLTLNMSSSIQTKSLGEKGGFNVWLQLMNDLTYLISHVGIFHTLILCLREDHLLDMLLIFLVFNFH